MITRVGGLILLLLAFGCGPAVHPEEPEPYKPLPAETEQIDKSPACLAACARLRELDCGFDEVNACEDWLCAAEFQNFEELVKAEACPL